MNGLFFTKKQPEANRFHERYLHSSGAPWRKFYLCYLFGFWGNPMACIIFTHFHSICIWERSFLAYLRVGLFIFDKLRLYKLGSHTGK